jgi:XRE family transcriptional regulator, regulator of sulfur utilization
MGLLKIRKKRGLTQEALAAKSGVEQTTISRLERHPDSSPQWDTVKRLADALGVDPVVIFPLRSKDREARAS